MLASLKSFLDNQQWSYSKGKDENLILFGIAGSNGNFQCVADVNEKSKYFVFLSIIGLRAPEDKIESLIGAINKINYRLPFGNFEIDYANGEIRFKTGLFCNGIDFNENLIENIIVPNIMYTDTYIPVFNQLILENKTLDEALKVLDHHQEK
ncbi:YbjN domain-containing protein [Sphingobacterium chuzhouense]|uniref:YbjN domain-containing protein n=1 Tax=Sphingobacterium chuzhouense TaxID=1742264 RepID=A0ABR7XSY4_9SPHI|nr:YbjN domain-containing protein [Sphingobacterium chuzhouense]MBD1421624.1 YbjN domain-containing protein [Sphingobacterium chuzhouense]